MTFILKVNYWIEHMNKTFVILHTNFGLIQHALHGAAFEQHSEASDDTERYRMQLHDL